MYEYVCTYVEIERAIDDATTHDAAAAKRRCDVFWKHARRILKTSRKFHAEASRLTLNFLNDATTSQNMDRCDPPRTSHSHRMQ